MGMINESMINEIVSRATKTALREYVEQFNIKNVYHVSAEMFDEFKILCAKERILSVSFQAVHNTSAPTFRLC